MTQLLATLPELIKIIGDFLIVISIYKVHSKLSEEKSVNQAVIYEVHHEKKILLFGLLLIVIGFALSTYLKIGGIY
jgi:uncharacterized membrane protein YesL